MLDDSVGKCQEVDGCPVDVKSLVIKGRHGYPFGKGNGYGYEGVILAAMRLIGTRRPETTSHADPVASEVVEGSGGDHAMRMRDGSLLSFRPFPLLGRPHVQTVVAAKLNLPLAPPSRRHVVDLGDGDRLVLEVSTPPAWRPDQLTVLLIHGLCGCGRSPYLLRLARKLYRRGVRAARMNLRGCGPGRDLARKPYHSGRSDDALAAVEHLRRHSPQSLVALVGFSLGGNIALKLAGELGMAALGRVEQVIAVCPPVDLAACSRRLSQPSNRFYERLFVKLLHADALRRHTRFPDLRLPAFPQRMSLFDFDEIYTAPQCGFTSARDYYERSSSAPLLPRIAVPCRILLAADDPLIDAAVLDTLPLPPNVQVARTALGGHLGFLGVPGRPGGFHWLDWRLLGWLSGMHGLSLTDRATKT